MKGLATIQSIELRHERYDDDVAFLIGRLRDLLGLPSTSPLPADQSARLTMLLAHLERLRTAGSWATTLLWAAAVVATLAIVDPAARITRQVSPEVADAVTRLNLRPDEAFPGRAASIVAAAPARRGLPDRALQPEARIAGDPRLAAQELSGKVGGFAASAWSFLPDASLRTTSIIAGLAGSVLPASAIGIVLFVRLKGLGLTTDLISWLESRTATSTRPAGSLARPAPASHVFDAIRRGHYPDVLGTPIMDRPPVIALAALLSLGAMSAYTTLLVYLGSTHITSSIVLAALPFAVTLIRNGISRLQRRIARPSVRRGDLLPRVRLRRRLRTARACSL
jgi:hypothetical protein